MVIYRSFFLHKAFLDGTEPLLILSSDMTLYISHMVLSI